MTVEKGHVIFEPWRTEGHIKPSEIEQPEDVGEILLTEGSTQLDFSLQP